MKKLFVESLLKVDPTTAWDLFESDDFRTRLAQQTKLTSEVIEVRREGEVEIRRLRFVSGRELPGVAAKVLGSKNLTYTQTNRFNKAKSTLDWVVELPVMKDRVSVSGRTSIHPHPGGCRRVVDGTIEVKLRLIGGQVEKVVANEFASSMEGAVELVRQMITEQQLA